MKEIPNRKLELPTLRIPPNTTPEEVKKMTQEFMEKLRHMGALPPKNDSSKLLNEENLD